MGDGAGARAGEAELINPSMKKKQRRVLNPAILCKSRILGKICHRKCKSSIVVQICITENVCSGFFRFVRNEVKRYVEEDNL